MKWQTLEPNTWPTEKGAMMKTILMTRRTDRNRPFS
jgi:hypothetical protein